MQRYVILAIEEVKQGVLGVTVEQGGLAFLLHYKRRGFCGVPVQQLRKGNTIHVDIQEVRLGPQAHTFEETVPVHYIRRVYVEGSSPKELNLVYDSDRR